MKLQAISDNLTDADHQRFAQRPDVQGFLNQQAIQEKQIAVNTDMSQIKKPLTMNY